MSGWSEKRREEQHSAPTPSWKQSPWTAETSRAWRGPGARARPATPALALVGPGKRGGQAHRYPRVWVERRKARRADRGAAKGAKNRGFYAIPRSSTQFLSAAVETRHFERPKGNERVRRRASERLPPRRGRARDHAGPVEVSKGAANRSFRACHTRCMHLVVYVHFIARFSLLLLLCLTVF